MNGGVITDWGAAVMTSLTAALTMFLAAIPRVIGFIVILVIGWLIAGVLAAAVAALLRAVRFNDLAQRSGLAGFVHSAFEGVLISTTSLYLAGRLGGNLLFPGLGTRIGTLAGFLLAVRWTSDMLFGPAIGALSDRIGQARTLVLLASVLAFMMIGVVSLSALPLILCLCILFVASAGLLITLAALANGVALRAERPHIYVGVYATAVDAGAAVGPLLAYFATSLLGLSGQYLLSAAALILSILWYRRAV